MKNLDLLLKYLQGKAFREKFGWEFKVDIKPDELLRDENMKSLLDALGYREMPENIIAGESDEIKVLEIMAGDLKEDLYACLPQSQHGILDKTLIGFLPTGIMEAFCLDGNYYGKCFGGNLICINYGLFFSCQMLAEALIYENLVGDLVSFRRSGVFCFQSAINGYFNPGVDEFNRYRSRTDMEKNSLIPLKGKGEITAAIGAVSALMLTFIALHEFGHIVNGDHVADDRAWKFNRHGLVPEHIRPVEAASDNWELESNADMFAIRALCRRSKSSEKAWINMASVHLLFLFLAQVEKRYGGLLSPHHPPPLDRTSLLLKHMHDTMGEPVEDHINKVKSHVDDWSRGTLG